MYEEYEVIGVQQVNYTSKKTGREVKGTKIFYTYETRATRGKACDNVFLGEQKLDEANWIPEVGDHFELSYSKQGWVQSVRPL